MHKFDMPYNEQLSFRDYYRLKYEETVKLIRDLTGELGKANLMQMIQTISEERSLVLADTRAQEVPANDFATFVGYFRDPAHQQTMTIQIVEDTQAAFAIRISECLFASTFQGLEAADIGYLWFCHADYTWAQGFNPGIRLVRSQTLMQGHACCDDRYTWEG